MNDYHLDLLFKIKNLNSKYIFFLQALCNIVGNNNNDNDNDNDNNNELEMELEKDLNKIYNKLKLFKEKGNLNIPSQIINFYNKIINDKIIDCCPHEFIEDDIDISTDKSQRIIYCSICENNLDDCQKNNFFIS